MPSGPLAHICLMVNDLDKAVEDWTKILSIMDPAQLEERIVRYDDFEGGEDQMRWVTFVNHGGAEIQLVEPSPDSPMGRRLAKHGESVHHICFTTPDPEQARQRLLAEGLSVADELSSDPGLPWQEWTWVLPDSGHGTLVEVARPYKAVNGKWEPGGSYSGSASVGREGQI
jgi:methylmalonyl-CoA/ethylmalonyl-CoA epimerase